MTLACTQIIICLAPCFARASASSFPEIPQWAGVLRPLTAQPGLLVDKVVSADWFTQTRMVLGSPPCIAPRPSWMAWSSAS